MKPPIRILVLPVILTALTLSACTGSEPEPVHTQSSSMATDTLDYAMTAFINEDAVAVVAQVRWPGGEWSRAYGVRDLDTKEPVQPGDRVPVASVTKTMTAVSVLKLVDQGLIGLDDPVNGMLESFQAGLKPPGPVTLRQLLSHTSGMPSYGEALYKSVDDLIPASNQRLSLHRAMELTSTLPWEARTVGSFRYSDSNYVALGLILETLRGMPYSEVLQTDIIDPLGLSKTTVNDALSDATDLVKGYITIKGHRQEAGVTQEQLGSPSHGVVSSMSDVNDFLSALFTGRLISATSLAEMKKPVVGPYGLGVFEWSEDCTGAPRYFARGGFLDFRTIALSSADGRYQATMTLASPPIATPFEDPDVERERDLWSDQIRSALLETMDRLCQ
jgi:D-alanyl-D-alanine carboxypeptidase